MKKQCFEVAAMFSDHMVLQREKPVLIWGNGSDGKSVCVTMNGQSVTTKIADNQWQVEFEPMSAGGPYVMECACDDECITFTDVMVGEVWLAGGQSNMELELQNCDYAEEELKNANYDGIRFYNVVKKGVITDEVLRQQEASKWKVCKSEQAKDVSAVAYFCARRLHQELGVAIGVIGCYIGGTSATCWMDEATLMSEPESAGYVTDYDARIGNKTDEEYAAEMEEYNRQWKAWDDGVQEVRRQKPDATWEYINERVGACPWPQPAGRTSNYRPANPYHGMLERVIPYTLRGFWYYQGEEDSYKSEGYGVLMRLLINLWREKFRDASAPFILNQLPMYIAKGAEDDKCWAVLREQQALAAEQVPNTYMNVLIDCGEFDNIHPTDKQTVGGRMALLCLEHVYGIPCNADAPVCQSVERRGNQTVVSFSGEGLQVKGNQITLFEVAGDDGVYHTAEAELLSGCEVAVTCEEIADPKEIRYAFTNYGKVTLFGTNDLPAAPFRSGISIDINS